MSTEAFLPTDGVHIRQLDKIYQTDMQDFIALKAVNLDISPGEFTCVVGRSGSGKSTLMNMITGIDKPTAGDVWVGGKCLNMLPENEMARWRGTNLGIVFQFYQLLPMLTLIENVILPMEIAGKYSPELRRARAMELLARVDLKEEAHKRPGEVSGGQQQSAAVARALANDPPMIIADEPTGNLDTGAAERIFHLFTDLAKEKKTIVMVTHDEELAARGDRRLRLVDGELSVDVRFHAQGAALPGGRDA
ncbi:MAG: ABC transporter ATP-binding protein [Anaerolineales bacterium]|nr:ABC transporter ATP-binding protein [Anaerolineales bacterium]